MNDLYHTERLESWWPVPLPIDDEDHGVLAAHQALRVAVTGYTPEKVSSDRPEWPVSGLSQDRFSEFGSVSSPAHPSDSAEVR